MTSKKLPNAYSHLAAMSAAALLWSAVEAIGAWVGLIYCASTGKVTWALFFGVYYLGLMIRTVGRELAYRDDRRSRPIYGDVHITGGVK